MRELLRIIVQQLQGLSESTKKNTEAVENLKDDVKALTDEVNVLKGKVEVAEAKEEAKKDTLKNQRTIILFVISIAGISITLLKFIFEWMKTK